MRLLQSTLPLETLQPDGVPAPLQSERHQLHRLAVAARIERVADVTPARQLLAQLQDGGHGSRARLDFGLKNLKQRKYRCKYGAPFVGSESPEAMRLHQRVTCDTVYWFIASAAPSNVTNARSASASSPTTACPCLLRKLNSLTTQRRPISLPDALP